tara:strand:+ start:623 stop:1279 length:657 start_codon:yes stop_codon:yes gene_type:complete
MKLENNWHVHAPWAPLVCVTKIPNDLFDKLNSIVNELWNRDDKKHVGKRLVGQIRHEYEVPIEYLIESNLIDYMISMGQKYWNTILTNGNMGTTLGINGVKNWQYALIACWCNYMRENEYNPIHNHEGEISAIIHLNSIKTTGSIKSNVPSDGKLFFLSGNTDSRLTEAHWNITPEEGMLYLFPSSLHHGVYPFVGKQERRSVSFNIGVKPDESQGAN